MINASFQRIDDRADSSAGIFPHLVNRASFADKIVLSVWGYRLQKHLEGIEIGPSRAIGGEGRLYARLIPVTLSRTGNAGQLKYGRLRRWRRIPPFRLILRSVDTPLDEAQVALVLSSLFRKRYRDRVAEIEMTFDTRGISIRSLQQSLFTSARRFRQLRDHNGNLTLYVGGSASPWQLRVYEKTSDVVRIEFILRRPFLQTSGIHTFEDLALLRPLDLKQLAKFMRVDESKLRTALAHLESGWRRQLLLDWPLRRPLQFLAQTLRRKYRINPASLLSASEIQMTLERMQAAFFW